MNTSRIHELFLRSLRSDEPAPVINLATARPVAGTKTDHEAALRLFGGKR